VLHTGLANVGAILHPTITLLNRDKIASAKPFDFYTDGVTSDVAETLARADAERIDIARAYGVPVCNLQSWIASAYGHHADSVLDAIGGNPSYRGIKAPTTLNHRYLFEDVPTGLIPLMELGRNAGVSAPTLAKLVDLARTVLGAIGWSDPRTLTSLGIDSMTPGQIRDLVDNEPAPARTVGVACSELINDYAPSEAVPTGGYRV
jgi:opine dehydrogenase